MSKIPEINLGTSFLSIFILLGFIATAVALLRLMIIGINYIKVNYSKAEEEEQKKTLNKTESKGF